MTELNVKYQEVYAEGVEMRLIQLGCVMQFCV